MTRPTPLRPARRAVAAALLTACTLTPLAPASAQSMDPRPPATNLAWWHPIVAARGIGALFLVDVPVRDWVQDHQGETRDDIAEFVKDFKDPKVFAVSSLGAVALGLVVQEPKVTVTGLHIAAA